jgi:hypothetical protein
MEFPPEEKVSGGKEPVKSGAPERMARSGSGFPPFFYGAKGLNRHEGKHRRLHTRIFGRISRFFNKFGIT